MINFKEKGSTLIEAIIALAVVSLILTAVVIAVITSLNNSNSSKDRSFALNYAEEGLDLLRDSKTDDFDAFLTSYPRDATIGNNYWCLSDDEGAVPTKPITDCATGNVEGGKYIRRVFIHHDGTNGGRNPQNQIKCPEDGIFVSSVVSWNDTRCGGADYCRNVELNSCFYNTSESL